MTKHTKKTDFERILSDGVDFKNRRIYFGDISNESEGECGAFYGSTVERVIRAIHKMASDYKHNPIELHMSSEGGDIDHMIRLYDAIQECPCQIKFYGSGIIMSSAVYIMASCDERYVSKNTQIMLHHAHYNAPFLSNTDFKIYADHITSWYHDKLISILTNNSRMPADFWAEITKRDLYLTPEEAIDLGLVDAIIAHKKRGNLRRKRIKNLNGNPPHNLRKLIQSLNNRIDRGKALKIKLDIPQEKHDDDIYVEEPINQDVSAEEMD